jgi:Na+-translocating ferredoxin:NAD+ oxidoreductase subunit B
MDWEGKVMKDLKDLYERLAHFLDDLPAGYPRTESGVELKILRMLFTPEEAELFMHLSLIGEEARVVAHRANQPVEVVSQRLAEMEKKGLVYASQKPGKSPEYMAQQFVVGFYEGQVNRLNRELVEAIEEYLPSFVDLDLWQKAPQLRTIPVGESIPVQTEAMPYEIAEEIIRGHSTIAIANCICRQEMQIAGKGCTKPLETCMSFGGAAEHYLRTGKGRRISQDEALAILNLADQAGLVLQPGNSKKPAFICACCGCCCGILRNVKKHPQPASIVSSPYIAVLAPEICSGCGTCIERCQMDAISLPNGTAELNQARCIGCGLCVSTCETGALTLERKPEVDQHPVPKNSAVANLQLAQARGKLGKKELASMLIRSKKDRMAAKK